MKLRPIATSFVGLIALTSSASLLAAGFQLIEQNASGIGNAYAGSAAIAENASTIFYNPAGMTELKEREISMGMSLVRPSFKFHNSSALVPPLVGAPPLAGNGGDGGSWAALPNGYIAWALNKDVHLGLGLGAPFGLKTQYDKNWVGSAHSIKFDIKTYNINPSIAWRVNDRVSLGAGLNYMFMEAEYTKNAILPISLAPLVLTSRPAKLKADNGAWGWNVGALFKLSEATRLGLSYRSKVKQELTGSLDIQGLVKYKSKAALELPDTAIISLTHQVNDRWQLLGDVSWTGWGSLPKADIIDTTTGALLQRLDTSFQDVWRYALGANYQLNPALKLKFGIAYDQSPVPDKEHRLVSLPDNDRLWLSFGTQWKKSKDSTLDFGATYIQMQNTKIDNNGNLNLPPTGRIRGDYDNKAWILGAQYSKSF